MKNSSNTKPIPEHVKDFILAEYSEVRKEIRTFLDETNTLARYAVILTGLIWAWLLKEHLSSGIEASISWLPLAVAILFVARVVTIWLEIKHRGNYIKEIEDTFDLPNKLGFEHSLPPTGKGPIFWSAVLFWSVFVLATAAAPMIVNKLGGKEPVAHSQPEVVSSSNKAAQGGPSPSSAAP